MDRNNGRAVVIIVNASRLEEAKAILEKFLMGFEYLPLGPLSPLRFLTDQPLPR